MSCFIARVGGRRFHGSIRLRSYQRAPPSRPSPGLFLPEMQILRLAQSFFANPYWPSSVYVRKGAGIETPADLNGKRIGVPKGGMATVVYVRGMLEESSGFDPASAKWIQAGWHQPGLVDRMPCARPKRRPKPTAKPAAWPISRNGMPTKAGACMAAPFRRAPPTIRWPPCAYRWALRRLSRPGTIPHCCRCARSARFLPPAAHASSKQPKKPGQRTGDRPGLSRCRHIPPGLISVVHGAPA